MKSQKNGENVSFDPDFIQILYIFLYENAMEQKLTITQTKTRKKLEEKEEKVSAIGRADEYFLR